MPMSDADWLANTIARNRLLFGSARMEADGGDDGGDSGDGDGKQTFTQADVDAAVEKIAAKIRAEERRKVSEKFADYDDLKKRAEGAKSLEDRVADIERQAQESEQRAMRAEIANAKGLSAVQAKRLIGATREELEADADELLKDLADRKKNGNHVPREGNNPQPTDDPMRAFARNLFAASNPD